MDRFSDGSPRVILRGAAQSLADDTSVEGIVSAIGDASLVLLGEATHGTHDFYALRANITRALIERRGFVGVAIEGDWPDAHRVNRYVQHHTQEPNADAALRGFERFPTWMWRNTAVVNFVSWLREYNGRLASEERVGFFGLDLYSLHASMRAVIEYLDQNVPEAAAAARKSYACFEEYGHDADTYAWAASRLGERSCAEAVARELVALQERRVQLMSRDGAAAGDAYFHALQNARLARNAEHYYRTMMHGRVASWNIRDQHMAETLEELLRHFEERGLPPKVVVWAHNSHLGDARATEMGQRGELNLGQLVREHHGRSAKLVGFTTYSGTVIAADDWGEPAKKKRVRPALDGSFEELLHQAGLERFFLKIGANREVHSLLKERRLERAIGVIYRPDTERWSHYFHAELADQFDLVIHLDTTGAVQPLELMSDWQEEEVPETYPSGV